MKRDIDLLERKVGTSRCDVPGRVQRAERTPQDVRAAAHVAPRYAARTARCAPSHAKYAARRLTVIRSAHSFLLMSAAIETRKVWTEAELQALPNDSYNYEVVDGELVMS